MKTAICIFLFIFTFHRFSYGQNKIKTVDTTQKFYLTDVSINLSYKLRWQNFADSISSYSKTAILPAFLTDVCLDWNVVYWPGFHSPTAVRWKIISLVKDRKSLELLLKNKPKTLKSKCSLKWKDKHNYPGDLTPPMNNVSTFELITRRLKQLK